MKSFYLLCMAILLLACGSPNDIVLGPEPLKQIAEQGDKFKRLPEEDRALLVGYLIATELRKALGGDVKSAVGRTVGEVLVDARAFRETIKAQEAEDQKHQAEAAALKAKIDAENKLISERISRMTTVAIIDKKILSKSYEAGRYSDMLMLRYALENKSEKVIRQIKGDVAFFDATGDKIGDLPVEITDRIEPGKTIKTDTGRGWEINGFRNGDIEKIAGREYSSMRATFTPKSIAFDDGEVLRSAE